MFCECVYMCVLVPVCICEVCVYVLMCECVGSVCVYTCTCECSLGRQLP